jgi:hypothetical protein
MIIIINPNHNLWVADLSATHWFGPASRITYAGISLGPFNCLYGIKKYGLSYRQKHKSQPINQTTQSQPKTRQVD